MASQTSLSSSIASVVVDESSSAIPKAPPLSSSMLRRMYVPKANLWYGLREREKVKKLENRAMSFELTRLLITQANRISYMGKIGEWKLKFFPIGLMPFHGKAVFNKRVILIADATEHQAFSTYILEMCNTLLIEKCRELDALAEKGFIKDRIEFALRKEEIEFSSLLLHHRIMKEGVEKMGWDPSCDCYKSIFTELAGSFSKYFERYLEGSAHFEYYALQYDEISASRALQEERSAYREDPKLSTEEERVIYLANTKAVKKKNT